MIKYHHKPSACPWTWLSYLKSMYSTTQCRTMPLFSMEVYYRRKYLQHRKSQYDCSSEDQARLIPINYCYWVHTNSLNLTSFAQQTIMFCYLSISSSGYRPSYFWGRNNRTNISIFFSKLVLHQQMFDFLFTVWFWQRKWLPLTI